MRLYAAFDLGGRDVEIGIEYEGSADEVVLHFDKLGWAGRNRPSWSPRRGGSQ